MHPHSLTGLRRCQAIPLAIAASLALLSVDTRAATYSYVAGGVWDDGAKQVLADHGPDGASASGSNGYFVGAASAAVNVVDEQGQHHIELRVITSTSAPADAESEVQLPSVSATAEWRDVLTVSNDDLIDLSALGDPYFYFHPTVNGSIQGDINAHAEFNITVGDQEDSISYDGPGRYTDSRLVKIFSGILPVGFPPPIDVDLQLYASAFSLPGVHNTVDFGHTVDLGPIYIGDANGNPYPFTPDIHLIGQDGTVYDTLSIAFLPEPAIAPIALAALAVSGMLRRRRRRDVLPLS